MKMDAHYRRILFAFALLLTSTTSAQAPVESVSSIPSASSPPEPSLPVGWHRRWFQDPVMNTNVLVIETGDKDKPTVVMLHGLGQNGWRDWRPVMEELDDRFHLVALDFPGFGRSGSTATRLAPENLAGVVRRLTQQEAFGSFHLAGHSMGGAVALYYSALYPDDLNRLTLVDAAGILHRAAFVKSWADISPKRFDFLPKPMERAAADIVNFADRMVEKINLAPDLSQPLGQSELAWQALLGDKPNIGAALALVNTDYSTVLESVSTPTLIIWGARDPLAPVRTGYLLDGLLPASKLSVIPDADHVPLLSHPREVAALLATPYTETAAPRADVAQGGQPLQDVHCRDRANVSYQGAYRLVLLKNCLNVDLRHISAQSVEMYDSTATFTHLTVTAEGTAFRARNSAVRITDASLSGTVAMEVDGSRLDMAGTRLHADQTALVIGATSVILASVSEASSPLYRGKLHGVVRTKGVRGEKLSALRSTAPSLQATRMTSANREVSD